MGQGVVVRPDQVSLGVLVSSVPRDVIDAAVVACGVKDKRSGGKLSAHVVAYLTMALSLFPEDDYEEVATKVTGSLSRWGCWDAAWTVPTASGITQARKRLGRNVMPEVFAGVAEPVATADTRGAWLREWRLLAIDGFDVDLPDTRENGDEFGYAGSGENRSALPKARVLALAECGTHAFLAAEVDAYGVGEKTLANRLYPRLRPGELLTADRGFYSWDGWRLAAETGADLLWRAPTRLDLPVVKVLPDGTYLSVLVNPKIRGARRAAVLQAARDDPDVDPDMAHLVRVVEYTVPDRVGNGAGELIVVLTTITDPDAAGADELADTYHQRWEEETANDQLKTHLRGPGRVLRSRLPDLARQEIWAWLIVHYAIAVLITRPPKPRTSIQTGSVSPAPCASSAAPPPVRRTFPPQDWADVLPDVLTHISRRPLPERSHRTCPRAVKRARHNSYRVKKPHERASIRHDNPPTIKIHTLTRAA